MKVIRARVEGDKKFLLVEMNHAPRDVWFWWRGPVWNRDSVMKDFDKRPVSDFSDGMQCPEAGTEYWAVLREEENEFGPVSP